MADLASSAVRVRAAAREGATGRRNGALACIIVAAFAVATEPAAAQSTVGAPSIEAQSAPAPSIQLDIPAQALDTALTAFADQAGLKLLYASDKVAGLRTQGIRGNYTVDAALRGLLAGTSLAHRFVDARTVTIETVTSGGGVTQLAPVTALGTRRVGAPLSNVPSSITVVDSADIRKEQATTNRVEDILSRHVPGFNPTNNGVRQIRGRTAQVFVNGVPVNEQLRASSGSDLNLVSPDQLAGVEVARGANSAYGFGSPGGVIALETPRAESEELTLRTTMRESVNPHHVGGSHQASLYQSASQIVGAFDYHLGGALGYDGAEYDPHGNLALGFDNAALLTNGKEFLGSFDGNFGVNLGSAGELRLKSTFGHVDFIDRYAINPGVYRKTYGYLTEEPEGGRSFRQSYTLNLGYENRDVLGQAVKLELFTSSVETETYSTFGSTFRDEQTNQYYGFRSAVTTPLDMVTQGSAVTYGVDLLRNRYFRPNYNDDTGRIDTYFSPDVTLDSIAPYAQLEVPVGDVRLTGGVRHEFYGGHIETGGGPGGIVGGDIKRFDLTLFNLGIVYTVIEGIDLYSTFSQGAEITQLGRAARDARSADRVDPQPAKSNQYELGVRGNWGDRRFGLAGFYTESDLLSSLQCDGINPCTPLREPREIWGVEATADWRIDKQWGVGGVLAWQEGIRKTLTGDTRRIGSRDVPPLLLTAYVDYSPFSWWRNTLQLSYRGSRDPFHDSLDFGEGAVDDLVLVNLSAGFDVGPGQLQVGVRNLLNTEYTSIPAEAGNSDFTWIPEQGRRVFVSYAVKW
jgi:iron complex outermembrane recepter protein